MELQYYPCFVLNNAPTGWVSVLLTPKPQLYWEDYRRLKAVLCGENRTRNDRALGYATYTEPQVGRVGITLEQATQAGIKARAVTLPMNQIARAIEWGHKFGFYRMVVDEETDKILGATLVGYETAELVHVFLSLIEAKATWQLSELIARYLLATFILLKLTKQNTPI